MSKIIINNKNVKKIIILILIVNGVGVNEIKKIKGAAKYLNDFIKNDYKDLYLKHLLKNIVITNEEKEILINCNQTYNINFHLNLVYCKYLNAKSYKLKCYYPFYDGESFGVFSRSKIYNLLKKENYYISELNEFEKINYTNITYWKRIMIKQLELNKNITFNKVINELIGKYGLRYTNPKSRESKVIYSRNFFYKYKLNIMFKNLKKRF